MRRREPPCRHAPPPSPPKPQSTSVPSTRNATRTWARHSSRFSPRSPVETTSIARMFRSELCACFSACCAEERGVVPLGETLLGALGVGASTLRQHHAVGVQLRLEP